DHQIPGYPQRLHAFPNCHHIGFAYWHVRFAIVDGKAENTRHIEIEIGLVAPRIRVDGRAQVVAKATSRAIQSRTKRDAGEQHRQTRQRAANKRHREIELTGAQLADKADEATGRANRKRFSAGIEHGIEQIMIFDRSFRPRANRPDDMRVGIATPQRLQRRRSEDNVANATRQNQHNALWADGRSPRWQPGSQFRQHGAIVKAYRGSPDINQTERLAHGCDIHTEAVAYGKRWIAVERQIDPRFPVKALEVQRLFIAIETPEPVVNDLADDNSIEKQAIRAIVVDWRPAIVRVSDRRSLQRKAGRAF